MYLGLGLGLGLGLVIAVRWWGAGRGRSPLPNKKIFLKTIIGYSSIASRQPVGFTAGTVHRCL